MTLDTAIDCGVIFFACFMIGRTWNKIDRASDALISIREFLEKKEGKP